MQVIPVYLGLLHFDVLIVQLKEADVTVSRIRRPEEAKKERELHFQSE